MVDKVYKCLNCGLEFSGEYDGKTCPICNGAIAPLRNATKEDKENLDLNKLLALKKEDK